MSSTPTCPMFRHPEYPSFLEEDWLFEAITETYIPLLHIFERLCHDGVPWRLTMSLTPPLLSMFMDPLLQDRYINHFAAPDGPRGTGKWKGPGTCPSTMGWR